MADTQRSDRAARPRPSRADANLTDYMEQLQDLLVQNADILEFLQNLAELTAGELTTAGNTVACGITVVRQKRPVTVAASDPTARKLDRIQNSLGYGPCLTALRTRTRTHIPDVHEERRWPRYMHAVAASEVGSILALSMDLDNNAEAVVNLYSRHPHGFSPQGITAAEKVVGTGAKALQLALNNARLRDARDDLSAALKSRTAIDTAVGIIMAQNRCSKDAAFQVLVRTSSQRNIKLHTIAEDVISSLSGERRIPTAFDE